MIDHAPYDRMWALWVEDAVGPQVDIALHPDADAGRGPDRPPDGDWTLVVVSAARAKHLGDEQAEPIWERDDDFLAGERTVVVQVDGPVLGVRAERCLADLTSADAARAEEVLWQTLRRLGVPPDVLPTAHGSRSARFPADGPRHCRLPPTDRSFRGRNELLAWMHERLVTASSAASPRALCLWGLGGVGKTSLALEYAHRFQQYYETIWWVRAETEADLRSDLVDLGSQLGVRDDADMATMLRELLRLLALAQGVLLILDNAEPTTWLRNLWPRGHGVHVLVTSRQPDWAGLLDLDGRTEVPLPGVLDAADLLLAASEGGAAPGDSATAEAIAEELGRLPLALSHAAAYVRQSGITLHQFHALLATSRQRLLSNYRPRPTSLPVALTWVLSLQRSDHETPGSADLMRLCAMLAPDDIPRGALHEQGDAVCGSLAGVLADAVAFDAAIRTLVKYSLVKAAPDSLRIHRLVQDAVAAEFTAQEAARWLGSAASVVLAAFPGHVDDVDQWSVCDRLTAHAQAVVLRHGQLPSGDIEDDTRRAVRSSVAALALRCGEYQLERGNVPTADGLLITAVRLFRETAGESGANYSTASARSALAAYRLADLHTARRRAEAAIAACTDGTDPGVQVLAFHTLSRILVEFSDLNEAYRLAERARRTLRGIPGTSVIPTGEDLLTVQRTLAVIEWRRGNYRSAVRWGRTADAQRNDRHLLTPHFEPMEMALAELLGDRERIRAIGERAEQSMVELEPRLGPDHPEVIGRRYLVAESAAHLGDHDKAERLLRVNLDGLRHSSGPEHPSTARAELSLGGVLCLRGESEEGLAVLQHALAIYERDYGADHPYAAEGLAALGSAEAVCGLSDQAEAHLRAAWSINERAYGSDHPKLAFIFNDLSALLLARDAGSGEAVELAARADAIRTGAAAP
ncbi:FxSxx-COOH system tetratricopeptide repeat protein [Streptomyces tauricus]|uniref:FxSxx-COOH system tetratricopeptide repeat protein n=1 Tax=Streptomyces tauricus TaxID=68274 RepID=A0ABZ1JEJ5_9ACTN|nr:FxSxx-COOH system tetratricopeptide repeat protein [Streptomyces tauricus]